MSEPDFELFPDFELDRPALLEAAKFLSENSDREYEAREIAEVVTQYLLETEPRERDFSPAMLRAKWLFKERCAADPAECPSFIWEQLMTEKEAAE